MPTLLTWLTKTSTQKGNQPHVDLDYVKPKTNVSNNARLIALRACHRQSPRSGWISVHLCISVYWSAVSWNLDVSHGTSFLFRRKTVACFAFIYRRYPRSSALVGHNFSNASTRRVYYLSYVAALSSCTWLRLVIFIEHLELFKRL